MSRIEKPMILGVLFFLGIRGYICIFKQSMYLIVDIDTVIHVYANGLETVRVKCHIFKVLRNGLLRYILYTCPNL